MHSVYKAFKKNSYLITGGDIMKINIRNTFHDKFVELTVRPLSESEYDAGKSGYYISVHSAGRLCNMYIRLSRYQTKRFFTETCGASNCSCHKFELAGF